MHAAGVVAVLVLGYALLRGRYPWPTSLTWTQLPSHLDNAQGWLLEQRTAPNPNFIFAILNAFRSFADSFVTAMVDVLKWMTWVGTIAGSVLIILRFGGRRPAIIVLVAFVCFALMGL